MTRLVCWFAGLPDAGPCDGRLRKCHLAPRQLVIREVKSRMYRERFAVLLEPKARKAAHAEEVDRAVWDERAWVWGCGGPDYGNAGHHGQYQPDGHRQILRYQLPTGFEAYVHELDLDWWLDKTYLA